jgi:hypothetical protein
VERTSEGYRLRLDNGEHFHCRRVVVATGLKDHVNIPPQFERISSAFVSHSSEHADYGIFDGKHVAVIGIGQSAMEGAALLAENGADVDVIARAGSINWVGRKSTQLIPRISHWLRAQLSPASQIGPFPLNWIVEYPGVWRCLWPSARRNITTRGIRPLAAGWLVQRTSGLQIRFERVVLSVKASDSRVALQLDDGSRVNVDHVLLATGYRFELRRCRFLAPELITGIASSDGYPVLSMGMESSAPGLHFIGASAVGSFGPLMRFVWGGGYASRSLTKHVLNGRKHSPAAKVVNRTSSFLQSETNG